MKTEITDPTPLAEPRQNWSRRQFLHGAGRLGLVAAALSSGLVSGLGLPRMVAASTDAALSALAVAHRAALTDKVGSWTAANTITLSGASATTRVRKGWMANQLRSGGENALRYFRFAEPADLAGTALLIHENNPDQDDLWLYLPAVGRARRIVSSSLKNSFIGSEFAFADLVTQQAERFEHRFVDDAEPLAACDCWVVDSRPRDADWAQDIGYARQRAWIRRSDFATLQVDYYNLKDQRFKRQQLSEFYPVADEPGRFIACRRQMVNFDNGRETLMQFADLSVNSDVDGGYFRPERLGRG